MDEDEAWKPLSVAARPVLADAWAAMGKRKRERKGREDAPSDAGPAGGEEIGPATEERRVALGMGSPARLPRR